MFNDNQFKSEEEYQEYKKQAQVARCLPCYAETHQLCDIVQAALYVSFAEHAAPL